MKRRYILPEKYTIPFLLTAGAAAIAYGMVGENNYVFIVGIIMVVAGYCLIRKDLKRSGGKNQDPDNSGSPPSIED